MLKYPLSPFRSGSMDVVLPLWNTSQDFIKVSEYQFLLGLSLQASEQSGRDMFCFVCSGQPMSLDCLFPVNCH